MSDYQQSVDRIRAFLAGADRTRTEGLAELATSYADGCREANNRLRRCVDYLRRGLRSEAIHLADTHPVLMDMVAALDISNIDEWEQICAMYGLSRPVRMMIESAQELNEAYAAAQPLQALFAENRLLALARGPLYQRLEVIRDLAAADPANSCWQEDQETFEHARLNELRIEASTAIRSHDLALIDRLGLEVTRQKWRVAIPQDIVEGISNASWNFHAQEAVVQLRSLVPEIRSTLQAGSYPKGKELLAKWKKLTTDFKMQPPQELEDEVLPLRQWMSEQEQLQKRHASFEQACTNLRAVMDAAAPVSTIKSHYRTVKEFDESVADSLERDYRALVKKLEWNERFEQYGVYALVGVVVLIILVSAVAMAWNSLRSGQH